MIWPECKLIASSKRGAIHHDGLLFFLWGGIFSVFRNLSMLLIITIFTSSSIGTGSFHWYYLIVLVVELLWWHDLNDEGQDILAIADETTEEINTFSSIPKVVRDSISWFSPCQSYGSVCTCVLCGSTDFSCKKKGREAWDMTYM